MTTRRYATRLNAFAAEAAPGGGRPGARELIARAAGVAGLTHVDLNYPDHAFGTGDEIAACVQDHGLAINGFAMRYYGDPAFRRGAFVHPEASVRRAAIDLTKRGMDAVRAAGADLMTVWLGQDGFDYAFQLDYGRAWEQLVAGLAEIAGHDPGCSISIEYKPDEPRAHSLLPDCATTLLALREAAAPNLGVTLDFAHVLYAGEQPACAAMLAARHSRVLGVHLNDGYGKRDDGLMVGAVHLRETLELLWQLRRDGYDGVIYFDTFPDAAGLDPAAECAANIATVNRLWAAVDRLDAEGSLPGVLAAQDAVASQALVDAVLLR